MDEHWIESCLQIVEDISDMLDYNSTEYQRYIESAQNVMFTLDSTTFFDDTARLEGQSKVIETLQRLAFVDSDAGSVDDIATWCLQKWLRILQLRPQTIPALKGIGRWWLSKAQRSLARINAEESSSSSSSAGTTRRPNSDPTNAARTEEVRRASRTRRDQDAETRLHSEEYVEARGLLLPATEYLTRAVDEGDRQGTTDGSLFVTAAEAHMSLGNVSDSRMNVQYFCQAIVYLRRASNIPGYPLPTYLQRYLDDYGPLVE